MPDIRQSSFAGGEVSPDLYGRRDLERLKTSAKLVRNWVIAPTGALVKRNGTRFVREGKTSTDRVRLVPFIFSSSQSYILEFGDKYVRFHSQEATVLDSVTAAPYEKVAPWLTADLPDLKYAQLNDVLTVTHPDYYPYQIKRYADDDWRVTVFSVDRPVEPPTGVTDDNQWDAPVNPLYPAQDWDWVVCSVDANGNSSLPSAVYSKEGAVLYTGKTKPIISWTSPTSGNAPVEYDVYRGTNLTYGYIGTSKDLVNLAFIDTALTPDYSDPPPTATDPFIKVGTRAAGATPQQIIFIANAALKITTPESYNNRYTFGYRINVPALSGLIIAIKSRPAGGGAWTTHDTITYTRFFGDPSGVHTYVATHDGLGLNAEFEIELISSTLGASVTGIDVTWLGEPASTDDVPSYPSCVCFYEQRLVFGGFSEDPSTIKTTRSGDYNNFDITRPGRDDDAIELTLASQQLDEIRSLVPLDALIAMTAGAEWVIRGAQGSPLSPTSFDLKPRLRYPASTKQPAVIGSSIVFLQEGNRRVRSANYVESQGMDSTELSVMARHLMQDDSIEEWDYAEMPDNVLWCVRSDGVLLGLTYMAEHQVWGWHQHVTDGVVESVCVVPEGGHSAVYLSVKRTIGGVEKRYIERMAEREPPADKAKDTYLDSALRYDGRDSHWASSMTLSGGSTWALDEEGLTLAWAGLGGQRSFVSGDVGSRIRLWAGSLDDGGDSVVVEITGYTSAVEVTARLIEACPVSLQGVAVTEWAWRLKTFTGLDHLEGKTVRALADSSATAEKVVTGGEVTLDEFAEIAVIGLNYNSDLESLPVELDDARGLTTKLKRKQIVEIGAEFSDLRSIKIGSSEDDLQQAGRRASADGWGASTGRVQVAVVSPRTAWDETTTVYVRHDDPVPCTMVALVADVMVEP